jgi:glycosyltransferase involved in cell wall biosynthesis
MENSLASIIKSGGSNYQKFGNIYRRIVVPKIIRKSKKIITVSNFEKNHISRFFNLPNDGRLVTAYNGVSDYFKPVINSTQLLTVKEKYNLPNQFFFFLGNTHPKKNTAGVLKAFSDFRRQTNNDVKLVMIDYNRNELQKLLVAIGDASLINHIVLTGYINNRDLPAIYSQSILFLYPSLRESFGIPIIEAMACGTPVITSNTSSMPEVAGNAACLVNPFKPEEITAAMQKIYADDKLRENMIEKGIQQAALFSWASMAKQVVNIYHETVNQARVKLNYTIN